jgi:flap endonuclease-1
VANIS